jgi:hypothetical protein
MWVIAVAAAPGTADAYATGCALAAQTSHLLPAQTSDQALEKAGQFLACLNQSADPFAEGCQPMLWMAVVFSPSGLSAVSHCFNYVADSARLEPLCRRQHLAFYSVHLAKVPPLPLPIFCSIRDRFVVPGMGTTQGFCASTHPSAICAGVAFVRSAMLPKWSLGPLPKGQSPSPSPPQSGPSLRLQPPHWERPFPHDADRKHQAHPRSAGSATPQPLLE